MSIGSLQTAGARIADCFQLDAGGQLVQRRDYLNLAGLGLTDQQLSARFQPGEGGLPEIGLADLRHLRYLDLTGNQLRELPQCVTGFTDLVWLGLNFNRIARLPEEVGALAGLRRLYLRENPLTELPAGIGDLQALEELDLTGCKIARLPAALGQLETLEYVAVEETALAPDLRAVWKEGGWKPLRKHMGRTAREVTTVQYVGKVVLVGAQENGKTCLQRALRGQRFIKGHKSTDGMSRERLHLRLDGGFIGATERARTPGPRSDVVDFTLWDMGGQESYQHTHQMFFTPAALYLVVTLPRQGGGIQERDRWIDLVKRRTDGRATVIVVSTWCRGYPRDQALTLGELRAKHGAMIRELVEVDSEDDTGIPELRRLLATVAQEPRADCRHTWRPGWARVLDELASSPAAFLRWREVSAICGGQRIADLAEQRQVVRTGHYIGALLWREDVPAGEDVVILNPDWLCRAVARLLDDATVKSAHGLVDIADLKRVWSGPGRDGTPGYDPATYPALIELMEINELAYRPKEPGKQIGQGSLLLLTQMVEDLPKRDVEEAWQAISPQDGAEAVRVIAFQKVGGIGYEAVPDIIYLLIFRLREFSLGRREYAKALHWQRGLLVKDDYGSVGRIELNGELLRITIRHQLGDGLMHSIVHRIGVRDDGYWNGRGLEKVEFVPCGAACARGTPDAGLISMADCAEAARAGNKSVKCETCRRFVLIAALLRSREAVPAALQAVEARLASMERNVLQAVRYECAASRREVADLGRLMQMQADRILDAFTSEWKEGPRLFSAIPIPGRGWNPKTWTQMEFRVTIWCEGSRRPVPLFREYKGGESQEFRGSEIITLTREWVPRVGRLVSWGSRAAFVLAMGVAGVAGGLVTAAGGVVLAEDAKQLAEELERQHEAFKALADSIPEETESLLRAAKTGPDAGTTDDFGRIGRVGFGALQEDDLKLIQFLREGFRKKDPTWGGLEPRPDAKFGRIWAHPQWKEPEGM